VPGREVCTDADAIDEFEFCGEVEFGGEAQESGCSKTRTLEREALEMSRKLK